MGLTEIVLEASRKYQEAVDVYRQGLEKDPYSGYYRVVMAICNLNMGKRMEAHRLLKENVKNSPRFPYSYYFLGLILEQGF